MASNIEPSEEAVLQFYKRLYPFKQIFQWLNHEHTPSRLFTHREFAFTLKGDIYLRYNSFASGDDLKKQICTQNPTRFEIGAVYSARPRDKKTVRAGAFQPILRELVFDIDMTDYDPVRTCCSGADICSRCWVFIAAAVRVLHKALQEQFGFAHILWVYSGRRGIHCWISDKEALELTDEQRKAIVGYLTVIQGGAKSTKVNVRQGSRKLHPSIQAAVQDLSDTFIDLILTDQDIFATETGWKALLEQIPNTKVKSDLEKKFKEEPDMSSEDKWAYLKDLTKKYCPGGSHERTVMQAAMEDIILFYTYPRLDAEVSKHRNHLLKAPFCIHPKTGRVCVPVDPEKIDQFKPEKVPTVGQLLQELDASAVSGEQHHSDWEKTSLKPYVTMLEQHALRIMDEVRKTKRAMDTSW